MAYVITEKAATALTRLLRGDKSTGNTGVRGGPATISPDAFPAPFTVRWSASEDNGSGAWVIWMPDAAQLLVYDGGAVTITGITAATELPAGWYTIDALQASSTAVYLVVTVVEATGVASAELSNTAGQATSGEKVYNLLVATMSTDATTGAKRVKQFVDSAVVLGGGSGGSVTPDDVSTEFIPAPAQGAQPDGDEGKLQIKSWKQGNNVNPDSLAEILQGTVNVGQDYQVLVRCPQVAGVPALGYVPIDKLYQDTSGGGAQDMTVEFVADVDWSTSYHKLRKRLKILNLRTGAVTDKPGTTYANGWEIAADSIGISSIIGS